MIPTCKSWRRHGGQKVSRQIQFNKVGEAAEGRRVDLPDLAVNEMKPLEVHHPVSGKELPRQDLEVVAGEIKDLGLDVQLVGYRDLTLIPTLNPPLAWKEN